MVGQVLGNIGKLPCVYSEIDITYEELKRHDNKYEDFKKDEMIVLNKVNSETDFAAKSKTFLDFIDSLGKIILELNGYTQTGLENRKKKRKNVVQI